MRLTVRRNVWNELDGEDTGEHLWRSDGEPAPGTWDVLRPDLEAAGWVLVGHQVVREHSSWRGWSREEVFELTREERA